ncbi:MAG: hypothetical protein MI810_13340 [Flavobacteriales bacterium]|nr:hypothetical protein [Flavobacteriales bacterium]
MKTVLTLAASVVFVTLNAQTKIKPQQNKSGKYGLVFANEEGNKEAIIKEHVYDYISEAHLIADADGPGRSPYFISKQDNKWGVLDEQGKELFEPLKADTMWLLRSKDAYKIKFEDGAYNYIGVRGNTIAADIVDEKRSPYARYRILVKRDGTQSIIYRGKEVVKPIPYELDLDIQNRARTFLVKNSKGYYVINLDGFPLNEEPFEAATPIDFDGNLAVRKGEKWHLLDMDLKRVDNKEYAKVERKESRFGQRSFYLCYADGEEKPYVYGGEYPTLSSENPVENFEVIRAFGIGEQNGKWGVLAPEAAKFSDFEYDSFEHSDKKEFYFHLIFGKKGSDYCLIDEAGKRYYAEIQIDEISIVRCEMGVRLCLRQGDKWALVYEPENEPNPTFEYEEIKGGEKGFYLKKDGKWGMMNHKGEMVADFIHDKPETIK